MNSCAAMLDAWLKLDWRGSGADDFDWKF